MLQVEVFIVEFLSVDRFASSTVCIREIPTLDHERFDNSVKD